MPAQLAVVLLPAGTGLGLALRDAVDAVIVMALLVANSV